jgi:hypothetical protein
MDIPTIADKLIQLQRAYASTYRAMVTEERYVSLAESGILKEYTFDSTEIREPLIEHVGHLPIIASFLHPLIEHRDEVDLGRALIMLSIHDIGETVVGDQLTYAKTDAHAASEEEAARHLLPDELFDYFMEMEKRESIDAKFAKCVDAVAPMLHGMIVPKIVPQYFKYYGFNTDKILAKKRPLFEWDSVLLDVFDEVIARYRKIEQDAAGPSM